MFKNGGLTICSNAPFLSADQSVVWYMVAISKVTVCDVYAILVSMYRLLSLFFIFTDDTQIKYKWGSAAELKCISRKSKSWGALSSCLQLHWGVTAHAYPMDQPSELELNEPFECLWSFMSTRGVFQNYSCSGVVLCWNTSSNTISRCLPRCLSCL